VTTAPLRSLGASALALALLAALALAHPNDLAPGPPTSYAEAVQRMRQQIRWIEEAHRNGDFGDVSLHAAELASLARAVPALSIGHSNAFADSGVGRIMQAGARIGVAATETQQAADRRDAESVAHQGPRFAELLAELDAYVPKQFVCPMHCEVGKVYDRPGVCPVCGMHLQLVTSDKYSVEVQPSRSPVRARVPVDLDFQIKDPAGFDATRLQVVHEKLLHLMIVSYDLADFEHVHPTPEAHGRFTLRHVFRSGGRYVLFHDFTPDSVGMQVVPVELAVEGSERAPTPLVVDDQERKRADGLEVALEHGPLMPGRECTMTFALERGGKPVTDLQPYLGVMGHLVMISEDRASFVHSHPLASSVGSGPRVEFKVRFERTGLYKAWGQFQRHGRVITVPFVVRVSADGRGGNDPAGATNVSR
jgi:hypothetical protein